MKLKKIIYTIPLAILIVAVVGTGCRKSQFNINQNPNDPTDSTVTYDVVLPAALHSTGVLMGTQWGTIQNWMGFWARSGTYAPNVTEETYQITTTFGNGIWNLAYDNNYDYNIVQVKAKAAGAGMYEGIARIMKAHNFQILVDVYGNVPYFQALKGSGNPTPAYDNGLAIYQDLLRQIDTGIALIKAANVGANSPDRDIWKNDIMFGDPTATSYNAAANATQKLRWAQFGNSLKLRLLVHAYAVPAINKTAEIAIINAEGSGYLTVDAQVNPGYKADRPMPFHALYKTTATGTTPANQIYYAANKWGIDYYKGDGDPRLNRMYEAAPNGQGFVGVPYGQPPVNETARANLAGIGPGLYKTATAGQIIMSAAEVWFLRAEARERGWITTGPTAKELMESGILASFVYLGVPNAATELANYLAFNAGYPDVDYTAGPLAPGYPGGGIATILSQKWFALNGINPLEVWTDWRRVPFSSVSTLPNASTRNFTYGTPGGYAAGPPLSVSPQLQPGTFIPVRYLYPQTEYNYNPENVGTQGTVTPYSRIFWDLN
jgi:Starch-binding associating with outer membrane